jgi:hypothetical protein
MRYCPLLLVGGSYITCYYSPLIFLVHIVENFNCMIHYPLNNIIISIINYLAYVLWRTVGSSGKLSTNFHLSPTDILKLIIILMFNLAFLLYSIINHMFLLYSIINHMSDGTSILRKLTILLHLHLRIVCCGTMHQLLFFSTPQITPPCFQHTLIFELNGMMAFNCMKSFFAAGAK